MQTISTLGHSTRSEHDFLDLLRENAIGRLVDIRRYPGSRRYPHFSRDALTSSMQEAAIEYVHLPELGGRRTPRLDSPNTFWRNEQFRAYADHMATASFREAVDSLVASPLTTAVMCAEAVPWRCHRNLLADELVLRGLQVVHILGKGSTRMHTLNPSARVDGDHLVYPASLQEPLGFGTL